jgi:hypothetical protein
MCRNELTDSMINEAAQRSGFTLMQIIMIMRCQRRLIKKRKERGQTLKKLDAFQDEKQNGEGTSRTRARKLTFHEQVLAQRINSKSGGVLKRPQMPDDSTQLNQAASSKGGGATRDFDWYRHADDEDAERIVRRFVPTNVRYAAVALAHQRMSNGEEGAKLWEKLRWTKRLRLCEEIEGHSF